MTANNILFARFFDPKNSQGVTIPGFFENLDFSGYSQTLDIIQEIAADNINMYLKNEYSRRYVVSTWAHYMTWNKADKRYEIDPAFYAAFSAALCARLLSAESFYQITQIPLDDIIRTITTTREYDKQHTKTERGDDTSTDDAYEDKTTTDVDKTHTVVDNDYAKDHTSTDNDYARDHTIVENTTSGFNSNAYQPQNKSDTDRDAHKDNIDYTRDARKDTFTTDTDARKDAVTFNGDERKTTNKYGDIDVTSDKYTNKETKTDDAPTDREKLVKLKMQLAGMNAYKIIGDAIAETMLRDDFDCGIGYDVFLPI